MRCKSDKTIHIGDQVRDECSSAASLSFMRPFDRGYCVNWPLQQRIWTHSSVALDARTHVVLAEPLFAPRTLRVAMCEVLFEQCHVASLYTAPPQLFASVARRARRPDDGFAHSRAGVVVDVGYSCSWIVPVYDQRAINYAARRVDVGGKAMTNHLKELLSLRHFDMMEETHLVNQIRESVCYVDAAFDATMRAAARGTLAPPLHCRYLLPNYVDRQVGLLLAADRPLHVREPHALVDDKDQVITLANERIAVPELLLRPSDVGLEQAGLAEAIVQAIAAAPPRLAAALFTSIELVGGCARTPGLLERLRADVRALAPADVAVNVDMAPEPAHAAWHGAAIVARQPYMEQLRVSRADYLERGGHHLIDTKLIASQ